MTGGGCPSVLFLIVKWARFCFWDRELISSTLPQSDSTSTCRCNYGRACSWLVKAGQATSEYLAVRMFPTKLL
jgi:hypothetical protein